MDEALFRAINLGMAGPTMDWIMATVTSPDTWLAPGILLVVGLCVIGRKKGLAAVLAAALSVGFGDATAHYVIKPAVGRYRPCATLEGVHQPTQVGCTNSFSFPSNHAVNSFAFASSIGSFFPKTLVVLAPVAALVGLSRVAVGVHYPADVVAGAALGILIGIGGARLSRRILEGPKRTKEEEEGE